MLILSTAQLIQANSNCYSARTDGMKKHDVNVLYSPSFEIYVWIKVTVGCIHRYMPYIMNMKYDMAHSSSPGSFPSKAPIALFIV